MPVHSASSVTGTPHGRHALEDTGLNEGFCSDPSPQNTASPFPAARAGTNLPCITRFCRQTIRIGRLRHIFWVFLLKTGNPSAKRVGISCEIPLWRPILRISAAIEEGCDCGQNAVYPVFCLCPGVLTLPVIVFLTFRPCAMIRKSEYVHSKVTDIISFFSRAVNISMRNINFMLMKNQTLSAYAQKHIARFVRFSGQKQMLNVLVRKNQR